MLVGELAALVLLKAQVDCPVDRLVDLANEPLSCLTGGGWQLVLWHAFLFQTRSQLRLPPAFFAVPLLAVAQLPMKRSVLLAIGGRDKVGDAHINADNRRIRRRIN